MSDRERQTLHVIPSTWNRKDKTNSDKVETDSEGEKPVVNSGESGMGSSDLGRGVSETNYCA